MVRAAVVGCGDVSVVHLQAIQQIEGSELVAICDLDPEVAAAVGAQYGVPGFTDLQEMIESVRPEVVQISTPHDQHVNVALACLEAGVAVLSEKPVAQNLAEAEKLVAWAAEHPDAVVGICFQNRYNATSQAARELLASGELGAVRGAFATVAWHRAPAYYAKRPWRGQRAHAGGGSLINQAIHTLDLLQWLLGDVTELSGEVATRRYGAVSEVEDAAEILLTHAGGVRTAFYGTLAAPQHRPVEIELDCENAYVVIRNGLRVRWKGDRPRDKYAERKAPSEGRSYWGVSHELLIRDFYGSLDDPEPFWIGPAEAMKSLEILKEVYRQSGL